MTINSFLDRLFAGQNVRHADPSLSFVDKLSASYLKKGTKVKSVLNYRGDRIIRDGYISMVEDDYIEVRTIVQNPKDESAEILVVCLKKESIESGEYVIVFQLEL